MKIEINILSDNFGIIDSEVKEIKKKNTTVTIGRKKYNVKGDALYFFPSKNGYLPTMFFKYGNREPIIFKDENKGIPARALHLLWNHTLYRVLVSLENDKTNLIIIILLIVGWILSGIRLYVQFGGF